MATYHAAGMNEVESMFYPTVLRRTAWLALLIASFLALAFGLIMGRTFY
jgi:hypothetical protein